MKQFPCRSLVGGAVFTALISLPMAVSAKEDAALEEIIVTATRVESSLQETAIAVSAFSGEIMDELNISGTMDYEALVPSLSIQLWPNRTAIRGVGRFSNSLGIAPGVAMYNDGAYLQENTALGTNALNTERVEIMRGPQGTLFGRNTTGGATNVIKRKPKDHFELDVLAGVGNHENRNFEVFVGGPVTDTVRAKLYYNAYSNEGLYKNRNGGHNTNGGQTVPTWGTADPNYYVESIVEWRPTDRFYLYWKIEHLRYSTYQGGATYFTPYDPYNIATTSLDGFSAYYQLQNGIDEPTKDPWTVDVNKVGIQDLDGHMSHTFHFVYDFDTVQAKLIAHQNKYEWDYLDVDYDGTSNATHGSVIDIEQDQTFRSLELTFTSTSDSPLQWVTGAYWMKDKNFQPYTIRDQGDATWMANVMSTYIFASGVPALGATRPVTDADIIGQNPDLIYYKQDAYFWNDNWSVFGEANYSFNDQWKLTVGARYSVDDLKGKEQQWIYGDSYIYVNPAWWAPWCPLTPAGQTCITRGAMDYSPTSYPVTTKKTFKDTSGRVIIDYTPDENNLYWLTISNAFKVGGIRVGSLQGVQTGNSPFFDGEQVTMYELGWKATMQNTVQLELIGYYYDYKDMQQLRAYRTPQGVAQAEVINVDTIMYGLETQVHWLATENLLVMLTGSYNHAAFDEHLLMREQTLETHCDTTNAQGDCLIDIYGNSLDITPKIKYSLNASYTINSGIGEIVLGATYSYVGDREMDIFNTPELVADAYKRVDLSATWTSRDTRWQVRGWVKNATDELWYNTTGMYANSNPKTGSWLPYQKYVRFSANPADPRMYQLELRYRIE